MNRYNMVLRYIKGDALVKVLGVRVSPELHQKGIWVKYEEIINTWRDWVDKHGRLSAIIRDLGSQVNKLQIKVSELEEENARLKRLNNEMLITLKIVKLRCNTDRIINANVDAVLTTAERAD